MTEPEKYYILTDQGIRGGAIYTNIIGRMRRLGFEKNRPNTIVNENGLVVTESIRANGLGILKRLYARDAAGQKARMAIFAPVDANAFSKLLDQKSLSLSFLPGIEVINYLISLMTNRSDKTNLTPALAGNLGFSPEKYQGLMIQARAAQQRYTDFGPGYGLGTKGETPPTFLTTPEPMILPRQMYDQLSDFGRTLIKILQICQKLPQDKLPVNLPAGWDTLPMELRLDAEITSDNRLVVIEPQFDDGALGLAGIHQAAYASDSKNQGPESAVAAPLVDALLNLTEGMPATLMFVYDTSDGPYISSYERFKEQVTKASNGRIVVRLVPSSRANTESTGDFILNYSYELPDTLINQWQSQGKKFLNPTSKGLFDSKIFFSLLFDPELLQFWQQELGTKVFQRFLAMLPRTQGYQRADFDLAEIRSKKNQVFKVARIFDPSLTNLLWGGKGVTGPWDNYARLQEFSKLIQAGKIQIIAQEYQKPAKLKVIALRGNKLVAYEGPNRICATFVRDIPNNTLKLCAGEFTISKTEPAKGDRECVMGPVIFN